MKRLIALTIPLLISATAFAGAFTAGDVVVVRVGDGVQTLNNQSIATFLDEYTPSGTLVQTVPLPTSTSGSVHQLRLQGSSTSEGFLQLSGNGQYLTLGGYDIAAGIASPATVASTSRVIASVSVSSGAVDTSTAVTTYTTGNIRGVASDDGTHFWVSSSANSVGYVSALGASSALQLSTAPSNARVTRIINGQLYVTSASTPFDGVSAMGTGVPNTSGQTTTLLNGFPGTVTTPSPYDFFIDASGNNAWVADDRAAGSAGGLQKWTLSAGTWTLQYTINRSATVGDRGLAVDPASLSGTPTFYVTTTDNKVDKIVDGGSLALSTDTTIFSDPLANTLGAFRGIAFLPTAVPEPTGLFGIGAGMVLLARRFIRRKG